MKKYLLFAFILLATTGFAKENRYSIKSPNGKLIVNVVVNDRVYYSIVQSGDTAIKPSPISMTLSDGTTWGRNSKLKKIERRNVAQKISSPIYKKSMVDDSYSSLHLEFNDKYTIEFRAYNDGAAYRFSSLKKEPFEVVNEEVTLGFPSDFNAYVPYVNARSKISDGTFNNQFFNSFENTYTKAPLSKLSTKNLMFLPILVDIGNGKKVCITEADLEDYPGLYLNSNGNTTLTGVLAPFPKKEVQGGHNMLQMVVTERESYIAKVAGKRSFPWRIVLVSENDADLTNNDMVYRLASPSRVADVSWIKPGKVAWDWWNDWGIFNTEAKGGVNTETYKHYIDFASKHGVEYVILDEGWAVNLAADLMQVVPEINLKEIVEYATQKNVGIILWAGYKAFDRDMENICRHYSQMGIKGFKIDFMDRDDQEVVRFAYRAAETCAKYKLVADLHGFYKPTGFQRTYPNVLNNEGVHGLEQMKWSDPSVDQVTYDVTIPFIRMVAGPMDYTQGAMRNAAKGKYFPSNSEPMSQGTRCRQLALYVVLEAPLNMMCDSPDAYDKEPECTNFIANVPVVWDETVALCGKVGEFVAIARRSGDKWYVGALTDWNKRSLELDLPMLTGEKYRIGILKDGVNADKIARDFKQESTILSGNKKLTVNMAPGGGYVAIITPIK